MANNIDYNIVIRGRRGECCLFSRSLRYVISGRNTPHKIRDRRASKLSFSSTAERAPAISSWNSKLLSNSRYVISGRVSNAEKIRDQRTLLLPSNVIGGRNKRDPKALKTRKYRDQEALNERRIRDRRALNRE